MQVARGVLLLLLLLTWVLAGVGVGGGVDVAMQFVHLAGDLWGGKEEEGAVWAIRNVGNGVCACGSGQDGDKRRQTSKGTTGNMRVTGKCEARVKYRQGMVGGTSYSAVLKRRRCWNTAERHTGNPS